MGLQKFWFPPLFGSSTNFHIIFLGISEVPDDSFKTLRPIISTRKQLKHNKICTLTYYLEIEIFPSKNYYPKPHFFHINVSILQFYGPLANAHKIWMYIDNLQSVNAISIDSIDVAYCNQFLSVSFAKTWLAGCFNTLYVHYALLILIKSDFICSSTNWLRDFLVSSKIIQIADPM